MHVVFRADASAGIGYGHVVRCLALAQALRAAGVARITFLCASLPAALAQALAAQRVEVVSLNNSAAAPYESDPFAIDQQADWQAVGRWLDQAPRVDCAIVDHYGIDIAWENVVRGRVPQLVAIDDLANRRHAADILLDPNLQSAPRRYEGLVPATCRRLLGPRFALLRPEFAARRAQRSEWPNRRRVLLFAGGGDRTNATERVLDAWSALPATTRPPLDVVLGAAHPHREQVTRRCGAMTDVEVHVQTDRMAELLDSAKLLIGAAGGISWERCCLGVPAIMFSIAPNQASNLQLLAAHRTGIALGPIEQIEPSRLAGLIARVLGRPGLLHRMSARAARLVDGLGAVRAALAVAAGTLELRQAQPQDDLLVWPWRNHPDTRRFSRDPRELTLQGHTAWWRRSLASADRKLFVARSGDRDLGVLRFDTVAAGAEISVYLDPAFTGLGLGPALLRAGQRWARQSGLGWQRLEADILPDNRASQAVFAAVGFELRGARWIWEIGAGC